MAVSLTATDYSGVGTGSTATYATGIYANASDQIKVYEANVLQTLGDDYSLNGLGSSTGVDVIGSFASGATIYIERVTPITQLVDTQNNETILEDVLDAGFDKLTMIAQEVDRKVSAALASIAGGLAVAFVTTATASMALAKNDFVNIYDNAGVKSVRKADASDPLRPANGFVVTSYGLGAVASVVLLGLNPVTAALTVGEVWLSDTVPGSYTAVAPSVAGRIVQSLGPAIPGSGIFFSPKGVVYL